MPGYLSWWVMRDSTYLWQARHNTYANKFARVDSLATSSNAGLTPPPLLGGRVSNPKQLKNPGHAWIFKLVGDEGFEPPTPSV